MEYALSSCLYTCSHPHTCIPSSFPPSFLVCLFLWLRWFWLLTSACSPPHIIAMQSISAQCCFQLHHITLCISDVVVPAFKEAVQLVTAHADRVTIHKLRRAAWCDPRYWFVGIYAPCSPLFHIRKSFLSPSIVCLKENSLRNNWRNISIQKDLLSAYT